jgi:diacylglycerol kinase family enzyme
VLVSGAVHTIDVGEVNGQLFLGNASIGLESEVTPVATAAPPVGGRAVYLAVTLYGLARWRPARFQLETDGRPCTYMGYTAAAANTGRFGGGMASLQMHNSTMARRCGSEHRGSGITREFAGVVQTQRGVRVAHLEVTL